ncbi:MAG: hypothetical protein Q7R99_02015 [bacterium]|nr:hypothetical protein [bacterium]
MKIYIDQSGKIESTNQPTVVAFSNGERGAVLVAAKDKREIQEYCRIFNRGRIFIYKTFACLIFILIRDKLKQIDQIIIDQEYKGHEAEIKHYLLQIIRKNHKNFPKDNIVFKQIGKKSNAHLLAYKVHKGKENPDFTVRGNQLIPYLFRLK